MDNPHQSAVLTASPRGSLIQCGKWHFTPYLHHKKDNCNETRRSRALIFGKAPEAFVDNLKRTTVSSFFVIFKNKDCYMPPSFGWLPVMEYSTHSATLTA